MSHDSVLQDLIKQATDKNESLSDKIFVDSSTVHPDTVDKVSESLAKYKAKFLAAPVFGGPAIAVPGKLVVAVGGDRQASEIVRPYIQDVIGRKVIVCSEDAKSASLLKIAGYDS